jgi:hypothetical protein
MPRSWRRLGGVLDGSGNATVEMTFDAIATLVDVPKSELKKRGFWKNDADSPQARAWLAAGYVVDDVDRAAEKVRFRRL